MDRSTRRSSRRPAPRLAVAACAATRRLGLAGAAAASVLGAAAAPPAPAESASPIGAAEIEQVRRLVVPAAAALAPAGARIEVEPAALDPRLRLAPCSRSDAFLLAGSKPWGRTRVALRCVDGPTRWSVYLPLAVHAYAPAQVLRTALPAGAVLDPAHLDAAEVDWAAEASPPFAPAAALAGRTLARPLAAGEAVRASDLRQRQWFAAGATVRIEARGAGFVVNGEGQALGPGIEGRPVRVRTANGRVLQALAVGAQQVEVAW